MIPLDKFIHFLMGYSVAATFAFNPVVAIGCAVILAGSKELYDYILNRYFGAQHGVEFLDFIATVAGGVAGVLIPYMVSYV